MKIDIQTQWASIMFRIAYEQNGVTIKQDGGSKWRGSWVKMKTTAPLKMKLRMSIGISNVNIIDVLHSHSHTLTTNESAKMEKLKMRFIQKRLGPFQISQKYSTR